MIQSTSTPSLGRVAVVGGGLGGTLMACYLARRGYEVEIHEARPDLRRADTAGPSMNLGLSRRGIESLAQVGLNDVKERLGIPMLGRVIHPIGHGLRFQTYGNFDGQVIYATARNELNRMLLDLAASLPGVRLVFQSKCIDLDRDRPALLLEDEHGKAAWREFDFIVGADGVFSAVRRLTLQRERCNLHQEYLPWGWKELRISTAMAKTVGMKGNAFHLWPRGDTMIFAHPNHDGSFTCSLVMPLEGPRSFASLPDAARVRAFFDELFPDLPPLMPDLEAQFQASPVVNLISIKVSPWFYKDRVVLLGDAAHAVFPFYAQGMNAAFESCRVLDECLAAHRSDRAAAFRAFEERRKKDTDALEQMSRENFVELIDRVRSPWVRARRRVDSWINRLFPRLWMSLHARVTHTTMPYAKALELARRQDRTLEVALLLAAVITASSLAAVLLAQP